MSYNPFPLDKSKFTFRQVRLLLHKKQPLFISFAAREAIVQCRKYLDAKLHSSDEPFYGINTGFGFLQNVKIDKDQLRTLQNNLLLSHACGMGEEVPEKL